MNGKERKIGMEGIKMPVSICLICISRSLRVGGVHMSVRICVCKALNKIREKIQI